MYLPLECLRLALNRGGWFLGKQVSELSSQVERLRAENAAANEQLDRVKELTAVEMNKRSQLIERGHMQVCVDPSPAAAHSVLRERPS